MITQNCMITPDKQYTPVEPLNVPAEHDEQMEVPAARIFRVVIAVVYHPYHPHSHAVAQTVTVASAKVHTHAGVCIPSMIHTHR